MEWPYRVSAAVLAYALFRFVLPAVPVGNPVIESFVNGVSVAAPLVVLVLPAAGVVSFALSRQRWREGAVRLLE